ncbi:hypothetical protein Q3W71_00640 [Micromonospora sp. C28SCA-DRY-2]|uniref:hypothetical protein n=1 Tax=Micromonospora sp. C28SCA-DRY-2 TaxID=3059522 RepID=UPI0026771170|nr:hypothetical protein [Micromonospora sp. C28SCA-DRY-2]MDO3700186.1 hypothetical protein [Micromonospora sp. C28SCA-DRY-2]
MTVVRGLAFDVSRALGAIAALLTGPIPSAGHPTLVDSDPHTGEWLATRAAGFVLAPLWEGPDLTGLRDPEWTEQLEAGDRHLATVTATLDERWGRHRVLTIDHLIRNPLADRPPVYDALLRQDLYGDLHVWTPDQAPDRRLAVVLGHSDGDQPRTLAALVAAGPLPELPA